MSALFLRIALAAAFLSAVADRFGLWGPPGHPDAAWGDFQHFIQYTAQLNAFLPAMLAPTLAWLATAAELAVSIALLIGVWPRTAAFAAGMLLLTFAVAMTLSLGIKKPLDFSVFTAAAGAFLLATMSPPHRRETKSSPHPASSPGHYADR